jgi:hypothetical protein
MTNREDMSGWQRQHGVRHVAGRRSPSLEETKRKVAAHAQERTAHQACAPIGLPFREPTEAVEANGESVKRDLEVSPQCRVRATEIITAGLRALAKKYHPDRGGRSADMREVLAAAAWLREKSDS